MVVRPGHRWNSMRLHITQNPGFPGYFRQDIGSLYASDHFSRKIFSPRGQRPGRLIITPDNPCGTPRAGQTEDNNHLSISQQRDDINPVTPDVDHTELLSISKEIPPATRSRLPVTHIRTTRTVLSYNPGNDMLMICDMGPAPGGRSRAWNIDCQRHDARHPQITTCNQDGIRSIVPPS